MSTKDTLQQEGWKLASITGGEHLRKTLAMYHELGIDTHLEEVSPRDCGECTECYQSDNETIYRIYTRIDESRGSAAPREASA